MSQWVRGGGGEQDPICHSSGRISQVGSFQLPQSSGYSWSLEAIAGAETQPWDAVSEFRPLQPTALGFGLEVSLAA